MSKSDLEYGTFTASEVANIVGMNPETLRVWRRRKNVVLEGEREGWTRFTFNDVMLITVYHRLTQSNCATGLAEVVSSRIVDALKGDWSYALSSRKPIYCLVNASGPIESLTSEIVFGRQELSAAISRMMKVQDNGPIYQVVDCTKVFKHINQKIMTTLLMFASAEQSMKKLREE